LQADTQTTITMLCLAGLHVLDKKIKNQLKNVGIIKKRNNVTKMKKNVKTCLHVWRILQIEHVNGGLYRIAATPRFQNLTPQSTLQVDIEPALAIMSRSDVLPNWYVVQQGRPVAEVLSSTAGYQRSFVRPFTKPAQSKSNAADTYKPLSPEDRCAYMCVCVLICLESDK